MTDRWQTLRERQRALGGLAGLRYTFLRSLDSRGWCPEQVTVRPAGLQHALTLRMAGRTDAEVFDQIFIEREYAAVERLQSVRLILDLGSNIGLASAFYLSRWPEARLVAVEPDPGNAAICRANLRPYGARARVVEGAIWHTSGRLMLSRGTFLDGRDWATEVREATGDEQPQISAWDVPSLTGGETIDLLKIDIEGSELALFSQNVGWLDRVRNMCVELHGPACEAAFRHAMRGYDFEESPFSGHALCFNIRRRACQSDRAASA